MEITNWRKTEQFLMPVNKVVSAKGMYDLYPTLKIEDGKIAEGFESLARQLKDEKQLVIDGYIGVFFDDFREKLDAEFLRLGKKTYWQPVAEALKPEDEIDLMIEPFLGGDDPIFGKRTTLQLADFFDSAKLQEIKSEAEGRRQKSRHIYPDWLRSRVGRLGRTADLHRPSQKRTAVSGTGKIGHQPRGIQTDGY